jgi:AcrR family transcriptional regulator
MAEPIGRGDAPRQRAPLPESLDARQRARRDRIVMATVEMLPRTEYEHLQMKEVTAAAGVALGTTYRYFNSKEHLVAEALLVWAMQFAREPVECEGKTVDRLKVAYHRAVRAFEVNPCVYGHMVAVQGSQDPRAIEIFQTFGSGQLDAFATYLARMPNPRRDRVIAVMNAVLGENLRLWSYGRKTIDEVYAAVDSAADLLAG